MQSESTACIYVAKLTMISPVKTQSNESFFNTSKLALNLTTSYMYNMFIKKIKNFRRLAF